MTLFLNKVHSGNPAGNTRKITRELFMGMFTVDSPFPAFQTAPARIPTVLYLPIADFHTNLLYLIIAL